jgi:hypothetical protein
MDMNEYVLEVLVRDRLADMRERESSPIASGPRSRNRVHHDSRWVRRSCSWDIASAVSLGRRR